MLILCAPQLKIGHFSLIFLTSNHRNPNFSSVRNQYGLNGVQAFGDILMSRSLTIKTYLKITVNTFKNNLHLDYFENMTVKDDKTWYVYLRQLNQVSFDYFNQVD